MAHPLFPEPDARHDCEHSWRDAGDDEDDNDGVEDAEGGDDKAGNAGEHLKGHGGGKVRETLMILMAPDLSDA